MTARAALALMAAAVTCAAGLLWMQGSPDQTGGRRPRLVVLVALDTLRADHLGCYGYARATSPWIDAMAREGVLFENAFSQANRTLASFSSLLTGRLRPDVPPDFVLPEKEATLASMLQAYGVHTLGSVAGGHLSHTFGFSRGFDVYLDARNFASVHNTLPAALTWIGKAASSPRPTFIFLHGYDLHLPYHKPLNFDGLFDPDYTGPATRIVGSGASENRIWKGHYFEGESTLPGSRARYEAHAPSVTLTPRDVDHVVATYDGALAYADLHIGRLLDRLREVGLANDSMVVLVGDHGEQLLESGYLGHGLDVDDRELHVPLIVWAPGILRPQRLAQVVELIDVMPTILDFMGVPLADGEGRSLRSLAMGAGGQSVPAISFGGGCATVRDEQYRLVLANANAARQPAGYEIESGLYLAGDTAARHNLLGLPEHAEAAARLRASLAERAPEFVRRWEARNPTPER